MSDEKIFPLANPGHFRFGMRSGPLRIRQFPGGGKTLPLIGDPFAILIRRTNTNMETNTFKVKKCSI